MQHAPQYTLGQPRLGAARLERLVLVDSPASTASVAESALRRLRSGGLQAAIIGESPMRILGGVTEERSGEIVGYRHGFSIRETPEGRFRAMVAGPGNLSHSTETDTVADAATAILDMYSSLGPL